MKKFSFVLLSIIGLIAVSTSCGVENSNASESKESEEFSEAMEFPSVKNGTINLFVTHGHCSTPFTGKIIDFDLKQQIREDQGNPLENMQVSFTIDPTTFVECKRDMKDSPLLKKGLFINGREDYMIFKSTDVYTMGIDWYQINGVMSIKGVEKEVKLFATGIRDPKESKSTKLIFNGELDLFEWDIDYDKIATGKSNEHPTRWMHLNMTVDLES